MQVLRNNFNYFYFFKKVKVHVLDKTMPYKDFLTRIRNYVQVLEETSIFFLLQ